MRLKRMILPMVAAVMLAAPLSAGAHLVYHKRCGTLKCRAEAQRLNLSHAKYVCKHGGGRNKRWNCKATKWLKREYHQTYGLLHPAPVVSHWAGWSCITNGAYPRAPHEGNGYNGAYTGWLGMTTPWAGHYPPGSDWVHSPQAAVYAIADHEASKHGYNYAWMQGQWPRTFPPCAHYFG